MTPEERMEDIERVIFTKEAARIASDYYEPLLRRAEQALESIATKRQEWDGYGHPDFDWRMLAERMEKIARDALEETR